MTAASRERLTQVLRGRYGATPAGLTAGVLDDLGAFLGAAPLADGLTVLVLVREA